MVTKIGRPGNYDLAALTRSPEHRLGTGIAAAALLVTLAGGAEAATKIGTAGNDTLNGTALADILAGRAGNDTLNGLAGADKLYGDTGNDRQFGGDGNDLLYGGPGNDTLDGGDGNDRLDGQQGQDVMRGGSGDDYLEGLNDESSGEGAGEPDLLYGGPGNDTLNISPNDVGYGGDGNDQILVCDAIGYGEGGNDRIVVHSECDMDADGFNSGSGVVRGGPGADTLVFNTPVCGELLVTYVGWEPGVDKITGNLWSWTFPPDVSEYCGIAIPVPLGNVRDYLLRNFDVNNDGHISKADGPVFRADGSDLTFPINPLTGKQSLKLHVILSELYLPDVTTLF